MTAAVDRNTTSTDYQANANSQSTNANSQSTTDDNVYTGEGAVAKIRSWMPETFIPQFVHSGYDSVKTIVTDGANSVYTRVTAEDGFFINTKNTVSGKFEDFKKNEWTQAVTGNATVQTVASFVPMIGAGVGAMVATDAVIKLGRNDKNTNKALEVAKAIIGTSAALYSLTSFDDSTTAKITTAAAVVLTAMYEAVNAGAAAPLKRQFHNFTLRSVV